MRIIIAGAGEVGFHLAKLLAYEKQDIVLIDLDQTKLDYVASHLDVAMEVFSGRVDTALAIRPVANLLGLDFVPLRWERYDLLISKAHFVEQGVQLLLGLLHEPQFREMAEQLEGYDLSLCGKMVFPQ